MLAIPKKRRKKVSSHFSSTKALRRSKMARLRKEAERFQKDGITRALDFEKTDGDSALGGIEEDSTLRYGRRLKHQNSKVVVSDTSVSAGNKV